MVSLRNPITAYYIMKEVVCVLLTLWPASDWLKTHSHSFVDAEHADTLCSCAGQYPVNAVIPAAKWRQLFQIDKWALHARINRAIIINKVCPASVPALPALHPLSFAKPC